MSLISINQKLPSSDKFALFNLGFRPFFLGALIFSIISMLIWTAIYTFKMQLPINSISITQWHAHEMIYGYCMSVIAGFLLTAVMNWTGVQTVSGYKLSSLFLTWVLARIFFVFGTKFIYLAGLFDTLFIFGLFYFTATPIIVSRQWKQLGILVKILLLMIGNTCFYLGSFGYLERGIYIGIYGGLYIIISLILTIGGRVIPNYIENGVDYRIKISNPVVLMILGMILFVVFFINQLFIDNKNLTVSTSIGLFALLVVRLILWHTPGIWKKPLLWSLYLSYVFIAIGFLLFALSSLYGVSIYLAVHSLTVGGIGLATIGMMSRVTLGHTGRSIHQPTQITKYAFLLLALGVISRVILPIFFSGLYLNLVLISQILWISAFSLLTLSYYKMLVSSRIDGKQG